MSVDQIALPVVEGMSHRHLDVDGVAIHVAEAGSGPPVLLLHGWPQHWYVWRKIAPELAEDHRVICPDLRGFGWSDAPPGAYDKATLARDMIGVLDALELDRVELIAHDWGAWIGFILCLESPARFAHYLALNIVTPWPEPPSLKGLGLLVRLWYQVAIATPGLGQRLVRNENFIRRLITTGAVHDAWSSDDLDAFADVLEVPARADASVHLYRTFLLRELFPYVRGQFNGRRLTVPTLLLHGTRDAAIDYRALGRWEEHADDMRVELREDSGHFIAEELPGVIVERARELFAGEAHASSAGSAI
jgi:pimeloyl-ACP methyl ester carboxylesterase